MSYAKDFYLSQMGITRYVEKREVDAVVWLVTNDDDDTAITTLKANVFEAISLPKEKILVMKTTIFDKAIQRTQPQVIVMTDENHIQKILHTTSPIKALRTQEYCYPDTKIRLIITYDFTTLLNQGHYKREAYLDWLNIASFVSHA